MWISEGNVLKRKHWRCELGTIWEREFESSLRRRRRRQPGGFHLVQNLLFRVRLFHLIRVGAARRDEFFQVFDIRLLFVVLLLLNNLFRRERARNVSKSPV